MKPITMSTRRTFFNPAAIPGAGASGMALIPHFAEASGHYTDDDLNIIGPKKGYPLTILTVVSMMSWMRNVVVASVK